MQIITLNNVGRKFQLFVDDNGSPIGKHSSHTISSWDGEFWALRNMYMAVNTGEVIGIIGRNGAGKSTLLNLIAGVLPVSEGEVLHNAKVSALLNLGVGFQDQLSGKENIYLNAVLLGFKKQEIDRKFAGILEFSELGDFINAPLGSYSTGMKMRLGFSVAIHKDFDVLVTDEIITVGDVYFQKKCFTALTKLKTEGKSMIIATQDMDLIQRFCDRVYLLEEGKVLFSGLPAEAVERYQMLLSKKKVLSEVSRLGLVRETKRWATDIHEWGKKEGTNEVLINNVVILNKWNIRTNKIKCLDKVTVRVYFSVTNQIDNFHFGIAIFREDGVYCYGPNTKFDGLAIRRLYEGKGYFELKYEKLSIMPGTYYISVVIWDPDEVLAYAYHKCRYKLEVIGQAVQGQLLHLESQWERARRRKHLMHSVKLTEYPDLHLLADLWGTERRESLIAIKCMNKYGVEEGVFITGRDMQIRIDFKAEEYKLENGYFIVWIGIYRSDSIYCHGVTQKVSLSDTPGHAVVSYPKLKLLPGGYKISAGVWDPGGKSFLDYSCGIYSFNMVSEKRDHGTIFLEHHWSWKIPAQRKK